MSGSGHGTAQELREYTDPNEAVARAEEIYSRSIATIREGFAKRFSTTMTRTCDTIV